MKGLKIADSLARVMSKHSSGKSVPDEHEFAHKEGPSGPEHSDKVEGPSAHLEEHDQASIHHPDMMALAKLMCPGCHDKLRSSLVARASGSEEPNSGLK